VPNTVHVDELPDTAGIAVQVRRIGESVQIVLPGSRSRNDFTMTPGEASALLTALQSALARTRLRPSYPIWAKGLAIFVVTALPAGMLLSLRHPATGADILVPIGFTAWAFLSIALARRDRKLGHPG
jgi:hypothetical protein